MMNSNCGCKGCKSQMDALRAIDFSLQETVLYLDAYPDNCEALNYYHKLIEQREQLLKTYEKQCSPVTMYGNVSRSSWDWVKDPWPWEADAN